MSFFYEKTFLLKYVMWIFLFQQQSMVQKLISKGEKKKMKVAFSTSFFIIFRERSYRQKNSSKNAIEIIIVINRMMQKFYT